MLKTAWAFVLLLWFYTFTDYVENNLCFLDYIYSFAYNRIESYPLMEFKFDKKGYLTPYEVIFCDSLEALEYSFVTCFSSSLSRRRIYMGFLEYLFDMGNCLKRIGYQGTWKVWIDGSFVSPKTNPNDLDLLNILEDTTLFHEHRLYFEQFFAKR